MRLARWLRRLVLNRGGGSSKGCALRDCLKLWFIFDILKVALELPEELGLAWYPGLRNDLEGEVRDDRVYIYVEDLDSAVNVLLHEVAEYVINEINRMSYLTGAIAAELRDEYVKARLEAQIYVHRERVVDKLVRTLTSLMSLIQRIVSMRVKAPNVVLPYFEIVPLVSR